MDTNTPGAQNHLDNQSKESQKAFFVILALVVATFIIAFLSIKKCAPQSLADKIIHEQGGETATNELETAGNTPEETAKKIVHEQQGNQQQEQKKKGDNVVTPGLTPDKDTDNAPADPNSATDPETEPNGAYRVTQQFINNILKLDPVTAKDYISGSNISYATLAGLCMMFEDGNYQLIDDRAVRQMFLKENNAGYLIQVQETAHNSKASFALNVKRANAQAPWMITEINLDGLLSHYATQVSGGDIHYSPLIKNPQGGESLAIYFDLDSNDLTPRTQKQLRIVNRLLKADLSKKLVISGHTDALGSDNYNLDLSEKRAQQVSNFLINNGLNPSQVKITGFGKNQPRRPNTKEDGADSPEGRRANRRAEILLDF